MHLFAKAQTSCNSCSKHSLFFCMFLPYAWAHSLSYAWAEPLKNKTCKSILEAFAKILNRGGLKTLFLYTDRGLEFANKLFQHYPKKKRIHFFNGTKLRNEIFHHRANEQKAFVSNLAILHIQRHRKIRRRASGFSRSFYAVIPKRRVAARYRAARTSLPCRKATVQL